MNNYHDLLEEHFGPTSVIIRVAYDQFLTVANAMAGQLTAALHAGANENVKELVSKLSQKERCYKLGSKGWCVRKSCLD